jgi:hypothetical protein
LGPKELGQLSLYQFYSYLYEIPNVEKIFTGKAEDDKKSETSDMTNEEVVERSKKSGFITPKKY